VRERPGGRLVDQHYIGTDPEENAVASVVAFAVVGQTEVAPGSFAPSASAVVTRGVAIQKIEISIKKITPS
jgi:hypothetical protein